MSNKTIISQYMSDIGKKGTGASKIRGNKKYYQHLVKIREAKRKSRAIEKEIQDKKTTPLTQETL